MNPLLDYAKAGASVPLLGFGNVLWEGVHDAVQEEGLLGIFKGGLTAGSAGTCAALVFGYLASLVFDSKMKNDRTMRNTLPRVSQSYRGSRQGLVQARTLARCSRK